MWKFNLDGVKRNLKKKVLEQIFLLPFSKQKMEEKIPIENFLTSELDTGQ